MARKAVNKLENTETTPRTPNIRVLKNGAIYDMDKKRITDATGITTKITSENAGEMQALAIAKKRLVMKHAANRSVQNPDLIAEYGDYAHVAERAITLQLIATTPEAGKAAVMAHQALTLDTGMSERQAVQETQQTVTHTLDAEVIALLQQIAQHQADSVIDVIPMRLDNEVDADE